MLSTSMGNQSMIVHGCMASLGLNRTLTSSVCVLWMGHKAESPVYCLTNIKEPRTLTMKEKGLVLPGVSGMAAKCAFEI